MSIETGEMIDLCAICLEPPTDWCQYVGCSAPVHGNTAHHGGCETCVTTFLKTSSRCHICRSHISAIIMHDTNVLSLHQFRSRGRTLLQRVLTDLPLLARLPRELLTPEFLMQVVRTRGVALQYIRDQTPELCMAAIQENTNALRYVDRQTRELCLEAVEENGFALEHVRHHTEEICLAAVRRHGQALQFVKEPVLGFPLGGYERICVAAIETNPIAICHVDFHACSSEGSHSIKSAFIKTRRTPLYGR